MVICDFNQIFVSDVSATYHYAPSIISELPTKSPGHERDNSDVNAELQQWSNKLPLMQRRSTRQLLTSNSEDNFSFVPEQPSFMSRTMSIDESRYPGGRGMGNLPVSKSTVKTYAEGLLWGDYFNSMLKCWEPLFEPFSGAIIHEQVGATNSHNYCY